jgi:hypothetical protein
MVGQVDLAERRIKWEIFGVAEVEAGVVTAEIVWI